MAYSINPNLPRARALAMKLLVIEQFPLHIVANRCGVHRSTVWRWKQKWDKLNEHVQFTNHNRPTIPTGKVFRFSACQWLVPTIVSRPRTSPNATKEWIVKRVLEVRRTLRRCAEIVWHHIVSYDGLSISLSSVRRILKRHHEFDGARKKRVRPDNPRRPHVACPGELVQTDTIHYVCPITKKRRYVYTVIDLFSRMAYAEGHNRIGPGIASDVVKRAELLWGFSIVMVQADNGPEFSRYFEDVLHRRNIQSRHSRLGRPNDNAHIERFNRTIQDECLGRYITHRTTNKEIQSKLKKYIEYYNNERVHLGIQMQIPAQMLQRS